MPAQSIPDELASGRRRRLCRDFDDATRLQLAIGLVRDGIMRDQIRADSAQPGIPSLRRVARLRLDSAAGASLTPRPFDGEPEKAHARIAVRVAAIQTRRFGYLSAHVRRASAQRARAIAFPSRRATGTGTRR